MEFIPVWDTHRAGIVAKLAAQFPLVTSEIEAGGRVWAVTAVQNQDALLDAADDLEYLPYGFLLWEAAVGLARYLAAHPALVAGKRILELGAGIGLPGIVARSLGGQVWQTDHQRGALALALVNAQQNGVRGLTHFLADWRNWAHSPQYDLLLGADILYERAMHFYLERIFHQNLAPGGCLLLSDPGRPQAMEFAAHLETAGWHFTLETLPVVLEEEGHENKPVEVAILLGSRE